MRIVQYVAGGARGCGVERSGAVFPAGYADALSLIQDGERGLERAAGASDRTDPVAVERLLAPLTNPGKIFGSGVDYASHGDEEPGFVFPDEVVWDFIKLAARSSGPTSQSSYRPWTT